MKHQELYKVVLEKKLYNIYRSGLWMVCVAKFSYFLVNLLESFKVYDSR